MGQDDAPHMISDDPTNPNYPPSVLDAYRRLGKRAVSVLQEKRGQSEATGKNDGPIVEWAMKRWLSEHRYAELLAEGKLLWCAGSAGSAYQDALDQLRREEPGFLPDLDLRRCWSLECPVLLKRHQDRGWARPWRVGGDPQVGDILYLVSLDEEGRPRYSEDGSPKIHHVRLYAGPDQGGPLATLRYVAGNEHNQVVSAAMRADDAELYAVSRVGGF